MTSPRRALVVVDVQQEYFDGPLTIQHPAPEDALANVVRAVAAARAHDVPVVVVQHAMPAGAPIFAAGSPASTCTPTSPRSRTPGTSGSASPSAASSPAPTSPTGCANASSTP